MTSTLTHAGPKFRDEGIGEVPWARWRQPYDAKRAIRWIEAYCRVPSGHNAGRPVVLAPFQREFVRSVVDRDDVRAAIWSIPRGNAKTTLAAMLGLYFGFGRNTLTPQVVFVSGTKNLARHAFVTAIRMVELSPVLSALAVYRSSDDYLSIPSTGGRLMPLVATISSLQGYGPDLAVVDETGFLRSEIWEAMIGTAGKRPRSLVLGVGTPGYGAEGWMFDLRGKDLAGFRYLEHAAPLDAPADDPQTWRDANPAIDAGFLDEGGLAAAHATMSESSFRTFRLGQWVGREGQWIPPAAWSGLERCAPPDPGERCVLFFDGSDSRDSTALVGCTIDEPLKVWVAGVWEQPVGDESWRVPRLEVLETIRAECSSRSVVELAADPFGWRTELEMLATEGLPVVEWPTNLAARMAPATDRFYQRVADGSLRHDHDAALSRHIASCVATRTISGDVVRKDHRRPGARIDLAVAAIGAVDRAAFHAKQPVTVRAGWAVF